MLYVSTEKLIFILPHYTESNEMIVGISNCAEINGTAGTMKADLYNETKWPGLRKKLLGICSWCHHC